MAAVLLECDELRNVIFFSRHKPSDDPAEEVTPAEGRRTHPGRTSTIVDIFVLNTATRLRPGLPSMPPVM